MSPKSLLRVAATSKGPHRPVSTIDDLTSGQFQRVLGDTMKLDPANVRKVLVCSGKVYYDLATAREARGINDVATFGSTAYPSVPTAQRARHIKIGTPVVGLQEPHNFGAWYFMRVIGVVLEDRSVSARARRQLGPRAGRAATHRAKPDPDQASPEADRARPSRYMTATRSRASAWLRPCQLARPPHQDFIVASDAPLRGDANELVGRFTPTYTRFPASERRHHRRAARLPLNGPSIHLMRRQARVAACSVTTDFLVTLSGPRPMALLLPPVGE